MISNYIFRLIPIVLVLPIGGNLVAQIPLKPIEVFVLSGHGAPVQALAFSPNGAFLCSGAKEPYALLWNFEAVLNAVEEGRGVFSGPTLQYVTDRKKLGEHISAVCYNRRGWLAISGVTHWGNGFASGLDIFTDFRPKPFGFGSAAAWSHTCVDLHRTGAFAVMGSINRELKIVSFTPTMNEKGKIVPALETKLAPNIPEHVWRTAIHPDGNLVVAAGRTGWIKYYKVTQVGLEPDRKVNDPSHLNTEGVTGLTFADSGRKLVSLDKAATLKISDVESGKELKTFRLPVTNPDWIDLHPANDWALVPSSQGNCVIIDMNTGESLASFGNHEGGCLVAVFTRDGHFVATGGMDHMIRVWDLQTRPKVEATEARSQSPKQAVQKYMLFSGIIKHGDGDSAEFPCLFFFSVVGNGQVGGFFVMKNPTTARVYATKFTGNAKNSAVELSLSLSQRQLLLTGNLEDDRFEFSYKDNSAEDSIHGGGSAVLVNRTAIEQMGKGRRMVLDSDFSTPAFKDLLTQLLESRSDQVLCILYDKSSESNQHFLCFLKGGILVTEKDSNAEWSLDKGKILVAIDRASTRSVLKFDATNSYARLDSGEESHSPYAVVFGGAKSLGLPAEADDTSAE